MVVICLALASGVLANCVQLKHYSSALVDCQKKTAKIFSQPSCESAHIVTLKSFNDVDVAVLDSFSFLDLFLTACSQEIQASLASSLSVDTRRTATTTAFNDGPYAKIFLPEEGNDLIRDSPHDREIFDIHSFPLVPSVDKLLGQHSDSVTVSPHQGDYFSRLSEKLRDHDDVFLQPHGLLERSVNSYGSLPAGCRVYYNSTVLNDDDSSKTEVERSKPN